jgi:hypothetical protein
MWYAEGMNWNHNKTLEIWVKIGGNDKWLNVDAWNGSGDDIFLSCGHFVETKEITHLYLALGNNPAEVRRDRPKGEKCRKCLYHANKALAAISKLGER